MKTGKLARLDIDALWNALQPRILGLSSGGTGRGVPGPAGATGPKGVTWRGAWAADTDYEKGDIVTSDSSGGETLTFFCIDANTSLAGSPPTVGGDTRWHEISPGYLIVDGSRAMTGDLDHGGFSIVDAHDADIEGTATVGEDVVMTGGVTLAAVKDASRIDFMPAVVPGTDYTAAAGRVSWAGLTWLDQLVQYVSHDTGNVRITTTGVYLRGVAPAGGLAAFAPVVVAAALGGNAMDVTPLIAGMTISANAHPGLTMHAAGASEAVWVCCAGVLDGVNTAAYVAGDPLWFDCTTDGLTTTGPLKGYDPVTLRFGTVVRVGAGTSGSVWVDPVWFPRLDDDSNVVITPEGEVDQEVPRFSHIQYLPDEDPGGGNPFRRIWQNSMGNRVPCVTYSSDQTLWHHDVNVNVECTDTDVNITLPLIASAWDDAAYQHKIRRQGSGVGKVIIDKNPGGTDITTAEDAPWSLLKTGECFTVQLTESSIWVLGW